MGALIAVYLMTLVLTELITNNAAAALAFLLATVWLLDTELILCHLLWLYFLEPARALSRLMAIKLIY